MREFIADLRLEKILLDKGFIETTSERNKIKGKKSFKLSKNAQKEIYFDYINIKILPSGNSRIKMTEEELKYVFLYFELTSIDFKELVYDGEFDFENVRKGINSLKKELKLHEELNCRFRRKNKIERILKRYNEISIS